VVVGRDRHGRDVRFRHPATQTAFMFGGEALCLIPFAISRFLRPAPAAGGGGGMQEDKASHIRATMAAFALPALCDAGATTLLNLGLFYTYASVFQMLRGTLVIFAGGLTVVILKRRLRSHNLLGLVLITAGAALVGASSLLYEKQDRAAGGGAHAAAAPNPLLGDILVVLAQLLNALQFVVEEKFLRQYKAPVLLAVGSEGAVGLLVSALALPVLARLTGPGGGPIDDAAAALREIRGDARLRWTTAATVLSIAAFNFCGVSVTRSLSGASRAAIDACRTAVVWIFCLKAGWERFHLLQVVGFAVLISGTSVYNDILRSCVPSAEAPPAWGGPGARRGGSGGRGRRRGEGSSGDVEESLLSSDDDDGGGGGGAAAATRPLSRAGQAAPAARPTSAGAAGREVAVAFADAGLPPPGPPGRSRAIAAAEQRDSRVSMARTFTMLPAALSPHSLGSLPSSAQFASVPSRDGLRGSSSEGESEGSSSDSDAEEALPGGTPAPPTA
jgi:drug/metabolite transporter (DMT)-like permease